MNLPSQGYKDGFNGQECRFPEFGNYFWFWAAGLRDRLCKTSQNSQKDLQNNIQVTTKIAITFEVCAKDLWDAYQTDNLAPGSLCCPPQFDGNKLIESMPFSLTVEWGASRYESDQITPIDITSYL